MQCWTGRCGVKWYKASPPEGTKDDDEPTGLHSMMAILMMITILTTMIIINNEGNEYITASLLPSSHSPAYEDGG